VTPFSRVFRPFLDLWCLWFSWIFMVLYRSKQLWHNCDTIRISQLKIVRPVAGPSTMSFSVISVHFVDRSFLAVHQTISESGYRMNVWKNVSQLDSQSKFQMFILLSGRHIGGPPTWRLHTSLYIFARNNSTNISILGQRPHLKLGELSSLSIVYNITISWLYPLNCFWFYFCVTMNTFYWKPLALADCWRQHYVTFLRFFFLI